MCPPQILLKTLLFSLHAGSPHFNGHTKIHTHRGEGKGKRERGKKKKLNRRIGKSESAFSDNREFSFTLKFEQ